jgi:predicted ribosome quality control (RQC) complex YloA/Tae2 family protein
VRKALEKHLKRYHGQIDSHYKSLDSIATTRAPEEFGHILMANLHLLNQGMEEAELYDFYQDQPVKIKLKPELNPQQNAEYFYNKQKKLRSRSRHLEEQIARLEGEQASFLTVESEFSELPPPSGLELGERGMDYELSKAMSAFAKQYHDLLVAGKPQLVDLKHPFHEHSRGGFTILVGKNAKQNDRLTFQYSGKTDTWLHARDVTGSHVIIRNPNGRDIPTEVLEFAAGLAAHFSKRKNEALVPVQYTERKYVRKVKDGPAGQVIVEREKVVMVEPVTGESGGKS